MTRSILLDGVPWVRGRSSTGGPGEVVLVAVGGDLYIVGNDLTVVRSEGLACIGCGQHAAYPAMDRQIGHVLLGWHGRGWRLLQSPELGKPRSQGEIPKKIRQTTADQHARRAGFAR